jgi:MarR family transcriptional regulator, transcriptional regulator for hemolysin
MRPARTPIGLQLTQASRVVSRAFDDALTAAGGSLPVWLVLLSLRTQNLASQRELAETMGIREATLTHHLTAMEAGGLISRRRHATNRRVQVVEVTGAGNKMFDRLARVATSFDSRLRHGITSAEITALEDVLGRLAANVGDADSARPGGPPWTALADSARG